MPQVCTHVHKRLDSTTENARIIDFLLLHHASEAQSQRKSGSCSLTNTKYLHDIFDARFDDAECRACSQVTQKSDWAEEVAESKAMLGENTVLLAIKVHPSSLQYQPAGGQSGVN